MIIDQLAPELPRTPEGWIQLPRDIEYRRSLFPSGVSDHPAKFNLYLVEALVAAYAKPGGVILDPFGGTGSCGVAALTGHPVYLCELETGYLDLLGELLVKWNSEHVQASAILKIFAGDCRQTMKALPDDSVDLVISSPPYPHLSLQAKSGIIADRAGSGLDVNKYKGSSMNFSRVSNRFLFNKMMKQVYVQLVRVLKPGGLYVSITKDSMSGTDRELLSMEIIREAKLCGLDYTGDWWKFKQPGGMGLGNTINASKGRMVVVEEDAVVLQKPNGN